MASVAELVEPLVAGDAVSDDVRMAAKRLLEDGAVRLDRVGPSSVEATVTDRSGVHPVSLESGPEGLVRRCDCLAAAGEALCAHLLATAIETWDKAPRRAGG